VGFRQQLPSRLQPIMSRIAWQAFAHSPFRNKIRPQSNFIIGN
jgi:hypothetical protein